MDAPWYKVSHKATADFRFRCLSDKSQVLFLHLCRLRNRENGYKWIQFTDERLSFESGLSKSSVLRARYELEMNGFVQYRTTGNKKACRYRIMDEPKRNEQIVTKLVSDDGPESDESPRYLKYDH